jgi:uncharacterized protein (TIGR02452 family)
MTSKATPIKQTLSMCLFELTQIDHERRTLKKGGTVLNSAIDSLSKRCDSVYKKLQSIVKATQAQATTNPPLVQDFILVLTDCEEQYKKIQKLGSQHLSTSFSSQARSTSPLSPILSPRTSKEEGKNEPSHIALMRKIKATIGSNRFDDIQLEMLQLEADHLNYANQIYEQLYNLESPGSSSLKSQKVALGRVAFLSVKTVLNDIRLDAVQKVLSKAISELGDSHVPSDIDNEDDQPLGYVGSGSSTRSSDFTDFSSSPISLPTSQAKKTSSSSKVFGETGATDFTQHRPSSPSDINSEYDPPLGYVGPGSSTLSSSSTTFSFLSTLPSAKKPSSSSTSSFLGRMPTKQPLVIEPCYPQDSNKKEDLQAVWKKVWNETLAILNNGGYTNSNGTFVSIDTAPSVSGTLAYCSPTDSHRKPPAEKQREQHIYVMGRDCLQVAEHYSRQGRKVAVLNMASNKNPGGGVDFPAPTQAQEEEVAKRTGLIHAIAPVARNGKQQNDFYPLSKLGESSGLYSPHVPVFRSGAEDGYSVLDKPFEVDIITVAAYKKKHQPTDGRLTTKEAQATFAKMYTMLHMAKENGADVVVLSAFGCGAYNNPPAHIAMLFEEALKKFPNSFDAVIFAIIDDRNARSKDGNFLPFARHFIQRGAKVSDGVKQLALEDLGVKTKDDDKHAGGGQGQKKGDPTAAVKKLAQSGLISFFDPKDPTTSFLSTFSSSPISLPNMTFTLEPVRMGFMNFTCAQAAYEAGKDPKRAKEFIGLDAVAAYKLGKTIKAPDWHKDSVRFMQFVLQAKFDQNPQLKKLLLATGDAYLVMHTDKDNFWGDGGTVGQGNKLGELLMGLRGQYGGKGVVPAPTEDLS